MPSDSVNEPAAPPVPDELTRELTREQIKKMRPRDTIEGSIPELVRVDVLRALCDMALRSILQPGWEADWSRCKLSACQFNKRCDWPRECETPTRPLNPAECKCGSGKPVEQCWCPLGGGMPDNAQALILKSEATEALRSSHPESREQAPLEAEGERFVWLLPADVRLLIQVLGRWDAAQHVWTLRCALDSFYKRVEAGETSALRGAAQAGEKINAVPQTTLNRAGQPVASDESVGGASAGTAPSSARAELVEPLTIAEARKLNLPDCNPALYVALQYVDKLKAALSAREGEIYEKAAKICDNAADKAQQEFNWTGAWWSEYCARLIRAAGRRHG